MAKVDRYLSLAQQLLPRGAAFTRKPGATLTRLLNVAAAGFADIDDRVDALLLEMHPSSTFEMLPDWETSFGLPDTCTGAFTEAQQRTQALMQKFASLGGQSPAYMTSVAEALGYAISLVEYKPAHCGEMECGDALTGPDSERFYWSVHVPGPRVTEFYAGVSECGDALGSIDRATDLECVLQRVAPAHSILQFSYDGV